MKRITLNKKSKKIYKDRKLTKEYIEISAKLKNKICE